VRLKYDLTLGILVDHNSQTAEIHIDTFNEYYFFLFLRLENHLYLYKQCPDNDQNVPTLLRCRHIKGWCSCPKTSLSFYVFFFRFCSNVLWADFKWVANREHVGWEKEKEDIMEWEKVKEVTTNPGRINCIARLRHFFLCHAAILSSKLHEYMFIFFVSLLCGFYLLGVYILCCRTLRLWISIIVSSILFVSLLFATQTKALFFFIIVRSNHSKYGFSLRLEWIFVSHSYFVVRVALSSHSPLSASDRVCPQCKVNWSDSLTSWTRCWKYLFFLFFHSV